MGTVIAERRIVKHFGPFTYYVHYWDCSNGIIRYDYSMILNWETVVAAGWLMIGGVFYILTNGAYGPELIPEWGMYS